MLTWLRHIWLLLKLIRSVPSELFVKAVTVARDIERDKRIRPFIESQGGNISFCPRCGQRPDADYRHEQAFERIHATLPTYKSSDIHTAIELAHKLVRK